MTARLGLGGLAVLALVATGGVAVADARAEKPAAVATPVLDGIRAYDRGDYVAAIAAWQGPAAAGDADAQFNLAQAYKLGRGVPQSDARAEALYARAAAQGHVPAADAYGLLLFQSERRREALPWLRASADRGEPRAQYVLAIAAYNGDLVARDPVTAYALMSRAAAGGLAIAVKGLADMDKALPMAERQRGVALAADLAARAGSNRGTELAAAGLAIRAPVPGGPAMIEIGPDGMPEPAAAAPAATAAAAAVPAAVRAKPTRLALAVPPKPMRPAAARPALTATARPLPPVVKPAAGNWRIQLGAFAQHGNADALWARVGGKGALAGHARGDLASGRLTRLIATGFAGREAAAHACASLRGAGMTCVVIAP